MVPTEGFEPITARGLSPLTLPLVYVGLYGAQGGTRTHNSQFLKLDPLPLGYLGLFGKSRRAEYEIRTRLASLEGWSTTHMPTPHRVLEQVIGFEPTTFTLAT